MRKAKTSKFKTEISFSRGKHPKNRLPLQLLAIWWIKS